MGNTLFDQWFAEHHYHEKDKTPLAKKIEQDREHVVISPEETLTQKALMAVGTSAGGRFKKAISSTPLSSAYRRLRRPGMTWPARQASR